MKKTWDAIIKKDYGASWVLISNVINTQFLGSRGERN